jgi:hypothetical protein
MAHLEEILDLVAPFGQTTTSIIQSSPVPARAIGIGLTPQTQGNPAQPGNPPQAGNPAQPDSRP